MKPVFILDADDALGFGLAGSAAACRRSGVRQLAAANAVYIVSASKADVVAQLPRDAPVVILPCRDTAAQNP